MKELELLGLNPDGEQLTLNDSEGNRYTLPITDELRAALRRDRSAASSSADEIKAMSPREIQSYIREGKSIEEVSELASLPPSRVDALAYPIFEERRYAARRACAIPMGRDAGAMTLEELVATRLAARGVPATEIRWDALRRAGEPWTLTAHYTTADRERVATWHVVLESGSCEALDEEAIWLSETPLSPETQTWRAPNMPLVQMESTPHAQSAPEQPGAGAQDASASPLSPVSAPSPAPTKIDAVLASLDSQRGVPASMPSGEDVAEHEGDGSEADVLAIGSASGHADDVRQKDEEDEVTETIFDLPVRSVTPEDSSSDSKEESENEDAAASKPVKKIKKIRKSNGRPAMPTWDEIVFGKKD